MTRIYVYPDNSNASLPDEDVWLEEDHPLLHMEYVKKWNRKHGLEDEYTPKNNRNFKVYMCHVPNGDYERVTFERRYTLKYYEVNSVEDFLREHPDWQVTFHRNHIFLKDWMD